MKFSIFLNRRVFIMLFGQTDHGKQRRARSDAAECDIWSGYTLHATPPTVSDMHQKVVKWIWYFSKQSVYRWVLTVHHCLPTCFYAPYEAEFVQSLLNITKTCLYNFDPLKPHFYIVKLGFTGVYIIVLISVQKHRLWVLVRTASPRLF